MCMEYSDKEMINRIKCNSVTIDAKLRMHKRNDNAEFRIKIPKTALKYLPICVINAMTSVIFQLPRKKIVRENK